MKKAIFASFLMIMAFSFVAVQAAADPTATDTTTNVSSYSSKGQLVLKMNDSIYRRLLNMYNKHVLRDNEWRNLYNRESRLVEKKKDANIESGTAKVERDGELNPMGYSGSYNTPAYDGVSPKQNWRRCAINYYVEGGTCSAEEMRQNLVYASTHEIDTVPDIFWKQDVAVIKDVRDVQRLLEASEQIGAGQQVQRTDTKVTAVRAIGASPYQKLPTIGE